MVKEIKTTRQRYVYKIHSKRFRKSNWDLNLNIQEAKITDEIVAVGESTAIRFIDQINGIDTDSIYLQVSTIRKRLKFLKKQRKSEENRREIKFLYRKLDELQFVPEYLLLIIDSDTDYWRAFQGFQLNGITYHRLLGTPGGIKANTVVFVADVGKNGSVMRDELFRRIENDRAANVAMVPAKLEAYRALTCSASTPVTTQYRVLVVPDCETKFTSDYILLDDSNDGEPEMSFIKNGEVELSDSDGYGLISYKVAAQWSEELMEKEVCGGFCIRNSFCKGMVFPFPFDEFAEQIAHNYIVADIWGNEVDIRNVDIILTGSMLKLWDSYESADEYFSKCSKNGYTFSITKTVETEEHESRELNYQFIQSYELTNDEISTLVKPTMDDIGGAMGGDIAKTLLFLKGENQNERTFDISGPDFTKALMIDDRVAQDKYVRSRITQAIRKKADRAKLGRIRVRGDYNVVSGDPYSLCQSIFGLPVTGLLPARGVYSTYWDKRGAMEVVCFRAPMTSHGNIQKMNVVCNEDTRLWYRYMKNVLVTNSWDMLAHALNGMDKDGDMCLTTDNPILLRRTKNDLAINCVQKKSAKKIVEDVDLVQSNLDTFGNDIGAITNRATAMYEVRSRFIKGSEEYKILTYRIMCCQLYQQNEIDKAKGIVSKSMEPYWYDRAAAMKKDEEVGGDLNVRIVADKKPRFMNYRYAEQAAEYNRYINKTNNSAERQFAKTVNELLSSEDWSEAEEQFVYWYYKKLPVGISGCTMNNICSYIEDQMKKIKDNWKSSSDGFNYHIYRSQSEYSKSDYKEICRIVDQYKDEIEKCAMMAKRDHLDQDEASANKERIIDRLVVDCYSVCNDATMLCNIILDATYGRKKVYQFAWAVCGEEIIKNLLRNNNNMARYIEKDKDGDIEYGGDCYTIRMIEVGMEDGNNT